MIFERYARHFERCPIWAWPWLWLQLFRIVAFTRLTGRKVLFGVYPNGWVKIRFVADPPPPPGEYRYTPPPVPRWQSWAAQSDLPEPVLPAPAAPAQAEAHGPASRQAHVSPALASPSLKPP